MKRLGIVTALLTLLMAVSVGAALAVNAGTYTPNASSFDPANAPGSSHLRSGTPQCVVQPVTLDVDCSAYVLGGVGNTNATVSLTARYSATINCTNHGGNLVESHTSNFEDSSSDTVPSTRNGQLRVPVQSASAFDAPQVCPNPNWTPSIAPGTLQLVSFTYTLTFAGFSSPYITIDGIDGN